MNAHETLARHQKATAIADGIWKLACEDAPPHGDSPPRRDLAEFVAGLPQNHRDALAREYGQHPPSEATWTQVVDQLRDRVWIYYEGMEAARAG